MELRNDILALRIDPRRGAKITSLVRLASGFEFLLQRDPALADELPSDVATYDASRSYGFDECVPTVAPCAYPEEPFLGATMPDHGDAWRIEARCERLNAEGARCTVVGRALPYRFEKTVRLDGSSVRLNYAIENVGRASFAYNWTAHPLLAACDGTTIETPATLKEPQTQPFSCKTSGYAETRFTRRLKAGEGRFRVRWPALAEALDLRFDPLAIPYAAIWITQGGWPRDSTHAQYTLAVEPTLAPGSLAAAVASGIAPRLGPGDRATWSLTMDVGRADR